MNIYINGRFLTQSITGVQRYAIEVVKALDTLLSKGKIDSSKYTFIIVAPNNVQNEIQFTNIQIKKIGKLTGHLWEQLELPCIVKKDFLLNLCNAGPLFKKNQITVIHDVAVYANSNNFSFVFKLWYKILLNAQCKFSKGIITVSEFSKREIVEYLNIAPQKVEVIYEGNEHFMNQHMDTSILEKNNLNRPYVLAVSSLNPNKNFQAIVRAIELLNTDSIDIVIAGGTDPKVFSNQTMELSKNVIYLGYVSDEELKALYKQAFCFIYPSMYEGFGLPPLEAMSIGCPAIISNRASLPEVGGDAVLYCDAFNPQTISDQIVNLQKDESLRESLIKKGKIRANMFKWELCAEKIMKEISKRGNSI